MSIFTAILLGIVQGIAEFLPISSSGHLSILQNLLKLSYSEEGHLLFDVLLHVGTLVAIFVYYRKDIKKIIEECGSFARGETNELVTGGRVTGGVRMVFLIIIATLPLFVAVPFNGKIEQLYYKTGFIGFALIMTGTLLFVGDRFIAAGKKNEKTMTVADALIIGVAQAIALIPGISRSGSTITVGMARGLNRDFAVRFSLLMSIPAIIGSTILSIFKALRAGITWGLVPKYLLGAVIAAVIGYFAIKLIHKLMRSGKFGKFSYYCWALGFITIILSLILN